MNKHAASSQDKTANVKSKDASPAANDYVGMAGFKQLKRTAGASPPATLQDRYEKRSSRRDSHRRDLIEDDFDD